MNLEQFASRGLAAQAAVDRLTYIANCTDTRELERIAADSESPVAVRSLANRQMRRLKKLANEKRKRP